MNRCEGFSGQVRDPVTEIAVTRRDESAPLAVEGMAYGEILALQPSQYLGRSGGSRPYLRKRASRYSYAHSSVPFTVDG